MLSIMQGSVIKRINQSTGLFSDVFDSLELFQQSWFLYKIFKGSLAYMKTQNFIQSRFCFYSAHECLLRKELMDLELVSGSKTEKKSSRHCYNIFQQNWDFKSNKIRLCRQRQMLNLFPSHNYITPAFPGELLFHMEAVITLYPKVIDY